MSKSAGAQPKTIDRTRSMETFPPLAVYGAPSEHAGLVLLYAPFYDKVPPAYPLLEREIILGRDRAAGIRVPDEVVSRQHAKLEARGDRWVIGDLGGRNGTIVNGAFVREAVLRHLDEIRIGTAIFKFVERDAEGYASYRIDGAVGGATEGMQRAGHRPLITGGYQIQRLAAGLFEVAATELSVLILGETGAGKEVFAHALHAWSGRRGPFQAVNCAAIPATLIEAELFGHRRGAFSGADRDRPGLIRAAHGGTLFLDEIGDMPLEAQAKLLRVLQSKEVTPVGSSQPERVDVRVVCATNCDLGRLQQSGRFRADVFARIHEYSLTLPPLRERKEDLYALCLALAARHGKPEVQVTMPFMTGLLHYKFPYNVRELEALIKRWAAVARAPLLDVEHLTDEMKERMKTYGQRGAVAAPPEPPAPASPPKAPGDEASAGAPRAAARSRVSPGGASPGEAPSEASLRGLLAEHGGNVAAVARLLGKDRKQVRRWIARYAIDMRAYR